MLSQLTADVIQHFEQSVSASKQAGYRLAVHLQGDSHWANVMVQALLDVAGLENVKTVEPKSEAMLGTEVDALIFDTWLGFNPSSLGIACGCIKAGGVLFLITPEIDAWQYYPDPDYARMLDADTPLANIQGRFVQYTINCLPALRAITIQQNGKVSLPNLVYPNDWHISLDQQRELIEKIKRVATGHGRRPLVIEADRGRGKTAALGIAMAELLQASTVPIDIIITAVSRAAVQNAFEHLARVLDQPLAAANIFEYGDSRVQFYPIDQLLAEKPQPKLLLVDEAAAIPTSLLAQLPLHFNRIVFATTVYGYEGNGRGFTLRFVPLLEKLMPQWHHATLESPIRWATGDPLEGFTEQALLLKSSLADVDRIQKMQFSLVDRDELLNNESLLRDIFSLLVTAHYQTSADDLRVLLDHPQISIAIVRDESNLLAVALLMKEGAFTSQQIAMLTTESRRLRGHILPQALKDVGFDAALTQHYVRVMRIATHPSCRRKGIAQQLLGFVEKHLACDFIGASFSLEADVLQFWRACQMLPVRLGIHAESSTGQYACVVVKALSASAENLQENLREQFVKNLPYQLLTLNHDLSADIVAGLFLDMDYALDQVSAKQLTAYVQHQRSFEAVQVHIAECLKYYLSRTNEIETQDLMLIEKVLLNRSWSQIANTYSLTGRKQAESVCRERLKYLISDNKI